MIRLISALVACVVAVGVVFLTPYRQDRDLFYGIMIGCGFLFFNLLASVFDMVLQSRLKMQFSALAELISRMISLAALYMVILFHGDFLWIASSIAIWGVLIFLFKWLFAANFILIKPELDLKVANWILHLSVPMGIVFIINNLYFRLDTLMLFVIKGSSAVGIYSVAYKILEVAAFFGSYFASSLKPALSQGIDKDKEKIASVVRKSISAMLFIALPIATICIAFADKIIIFLSNPEFISGSIALIILAFALPFLYLDVLLAEIFIANDNRRLLLTVSLSVLAFNFIANLIILPIYSFVGAATTTLISEILLFGLYVAYTRKIIPYKFDYLTTSKIVGASLICYFFANLASNLNLNFLIIVGLTFLLYGILSYTFRIVRIGTLREVLGQKNS